MNRVIPDLSGYRDYLQQSANPESLLPITTPLPQSPPKFISDHRSESYKLFNWGSLEYHPFPKSYVLPKGNVRTAWFHWMCSTSITVDGESSQIRPLRKMKMHAKGNPEVLRIGKRISELRKLLSPLEAKARLHNSWKEEPSIEEAVELFDQADLISALPSSRKRKRVDQISWSTLAKNAYSNK